MKDIHVWMDATLREMPTALANKKTVAAMQKTIAILMAAAIVNAGTFALAGASEEEEPPDEEIIVIEKRWIKSGPFPRSSPQLLAVLFVPPTQSFAEESGERSKEPEEEKEKENSDRIGCWRELTANKDANLSGTFGEMRGNRPHQGIDIKVVTGTKVYAAQSGTVERVKNDMEVGQRPTPEEEEQNINTAGNFVVIKDAEGRTHRYLHLKNTSLKKEDQVRVGDLIGTSNDTGKSRGPHLHYDLSDSSGQRMDPEKEFACDDEE